MYKHKGKGHTNHDRLFRKILSNLDAARLFLQSSLPASILNLKIDWSTLKIKVTDFISAKFDVKKTDVLFSVNINNEPNLNYAVIH